MSGMCLARWYACGALTAVALEAAEVSFRERSRCTEACAVTWTGSECKELDGVPTPATKTWPAESTATARAESEMREGCVTGKVWKTSGSVVRARESGSRKMKERSVFFIVKGVARGGRTVAEGEGPTWCEGGREIKRGEVQLRWTWS